MPPRRPPLEAAIRAVNGAPDGDAVRAALNESALAHVLALAPSADSVVHAMAALRCGFIALLDADDVASPAVRDAIRSRIGTPEGYHVLQAWAEVAPAGWGADIAHALIAAVQNGTCAPAIAAALIGPCDRSTDLLRTPQDIALAVRCWAQDAPDRPTAWMEGVSPAICDRLCADVAQNAICLAMCLPWLPPTTRQTVTIKGNAIAIALDAFAAASPVARTLHADLLNQLIAAAQPEHLAILTPLALAMKIDIVQRRVQELTVKHPDDVNSIVVVAPSWEAVPENVQRAILDAADESDICAAIAVAQGRRKDAPITGQTAPAFFTALDPKVWDAMDAATQRRWMDAAGAFAMHLAVRALGPRPEILANAMLHNNLVQATLRHAPDDRTLRWTLLPVALQSVDIGDASSLIAALPTMPPDPGAFFCIASKRCDVKVAASARDILRTPADLAAAVALQRITGNSVRWKEACMAFPRTLHGRTWNETTPLLALVDDNARALLTPNRDALADALATPQRRSAMRRTLDEIAALPPEVAVPVLVALEHWRRGSDTTQHVTEALAHALRAHGDLVMAVVDALKFDLAREAPLPLPRHPDLADALRAAMRADSVIGRTLAHALHDKAWDAAGAALRDAPPPHAHAIWRALSDDDRTALLSAAETRVRSLAAGEHGDNLCIAWRRIAGAAPLVALKMTALASDDPDARACGVDALADAPQIVRSIVALLRPDIQNFLRAHPVLAAALADLDDDPPSARPTRGMPGAIRRRT